MPDRAAAPPGLSLHLLLGAFPLICFLGALVTDVAYANTADMQWANFSVWLLAAGLLFGGLSFVVGVVAYWRDRRRTSAVAAIVHGLGTLVVLLLALWNAFVHSRDAWTSVVPTGLTLSVVTVVLMLATGWIGGLLAYRQRTYDTRTGGRF